MAAPDSRRRPAVRHAPLAVAAAVFLGTAVVLAVRGAAPTAVGLQLASILALTFPLNVERRQGLRVPTALVAMFAALMLAGPWLGTTLGFYDVWTDWDTVVHAFSGLPISLAALYGLGVLAHRRGLVLPDGLVVVVVLGVHALAAVAWEILEFVSDQVLDGDAQRGNTDTMVDLIAGTVVSVLVAVAVLQWRRHGRFGFVGRLLGERPAAA